MKLTNPQFEGQTKAKLGNSEMRTLVDNVVFDRLSVFLEENPAVGRIVLEKAMTAARAREAARKARENIRRKNGLEGFNMPDKLRDCFFNDPATTEIYTLSLHDALPISVLAADVLSGLARGLADAGGGHGLFKHDSSDGGILDRKSTRLNSSHAKTSRMPSSA